MERLYELINEMEAELMRAKKAAFSSTDVVVNKREMLSLLDRISASLPSAIKEAQLVVNNKDTLVREAKEFADATRAEAENKANEMVAQDTIIARAREAAEQLMRDAEDFCRDQEANARHKIDCLLADSEEYLTRAVLTIRQNRDDLLGKK